MKIINTEEKKRRLKTKKILKHTLLTNSDDIHVWAMQDIRDSTKLQFN
jgi:hypothetical protein